MANELFADDLIEALGKIEILNGQCVVVLGNKASAINATIVSAGCKFFYSDNSDYTDGPRQVNISPGNNTSFYSSSPEKCVTSVFVAFTVTAPGYKPANFTWQDGAGQGQCLLTTGVDLAPVGQVSQNDLNNIRIDTLLTVKDAN